ncbi:MAG: hypothetical protein GX605_12790 [Chloroflexi bacterium]|nr:hypothetical protein [Chloroflexota bacterium]
MERLLRGRGVRTWGLMLVEDTLMLTVPLPQAAYAAYLLEQADIPFGGPKPAAPQGGSKPGRPHTDDPLAALQGWADDLAEGLARWLPH